MENIKSIPKEKFAFVGKRDMSHDKKLATKPVGYFHDAFKRFCKNKGAIFGAIVIIFLILFAIIAPFCTQFTVGYADVTYAVARPYNKLFENTSFWDGCEGRQIGKHDLTYYLAMGEESGHYAIKNQEYTDNGDDLYSVRLNSVHKVGMKYQNFSRDQYNAIQEYQNRTGRQVIYPTIATKDRPAALQDQTDANYYYKTSGTSKTNIVYDNDGNIIPVYWSYTADSLADGAEVGDVDGYYSLRVEGNDGFVDEDGNVSYYRYARVTQTGYECRINYYEYYIYYHTEIVKDGITEPAFLFGTTGTGQDIFTALGTGARFSFIFSLAVAVVNLFVGAIYGSIAGYYGGKIDLFMERFSDILSAVPTMIVITLLKMHLGASSDMIVLFIAFFMTGWIGMAGTTRMQFYRYKNQEYVLAARTLGAKDGRIMFKHIFPNALGTIVTSCALVIPSMIYAETNLSYLSIINLSTGDLTSVGTLIAQGQKYLSTAPYMALFPSLFLALMMLSFNLFGNGLRDAFNPSLRGSEG